MEARTNSVPRASQTGHRQGSLGANRRESSRSLATRELARPQHCLTQRLLCGARASTHGLHGVSLIRRTAVCGPACTVVWQGRRGDPLPYAASEQVPGDGSRGEGKIASGSWLLADFKPNGSIRCLMRIRVGASTHQPEAALVTCDLPLGPDQRSDPYRSKERV